MKRLIPLSLCAFFVTNSYSQLSKGNWLVGGSISYSKENSRGTDAVDSKGRNIDISGNVGYFIVSKFAAGIRLNSFFSKQNYPQIDGTYSANTQNNLGIGPFVRYYFLKEDNTINIFSDEGIIYSALTVKTPNTEKSHFNSFQYYLSGGAVVFLNSSVGIELVLSYYNTKAIKYDSKGESFQFKVGLQFHLEKEKD
jgi:hypothetical protein